ncbi:MAG: hypothetical protein ACI97K_002548 [Glaciecola sp.]|jgi:hypothetical protein
MKKKKRSQELKASYQAMVYSVVEHQNERELTKNTDNVFSILGHRTRLVEIPRSILV